MDNEMKVIYYKTVPVPDKDSELLQYGFEVIRENKLLHLVLLDKGGNGDSVKRYYIHGYQASEYFVYRAKEHIQHTCDYIANEYKVVDIEDIKTLLIRKGMSIDNESFFEPFYIE